MLACLETDERDVWWNWISNGGHTTLDALGISNRFGGYEPRHLADALGPERIEWLRKRPLYYIDGDYLFVHAGIAPSVPLTQQKRDDMLWIRTRFLESTLRHDYIVVHGHTQNSRAWSHSNRGPRTSAQ